MVKYLLLLALMTGCASTQYVTTRHFTAPKTPFKKVLIGAYVNPFIKEKMENKFAQVLSQQFEPEFLPAASFPEIQSITTIKGMQTFLKKHKFDGILTFNSLGSTSQTSTSYIPTVNTTSGTVGNQQIYLNSYGSQAIQTTVYNWQGLVQLWDWKNSDQPIWKMMTATQGKSFNPMWGSLFLNLKKAFVKENVFAPKPASAHQVATQ